MRIAICIAAIATMVGTCYRAGNVGPLAANENVLDYRINKNRYAVVVLQEKGMSQSQARKIAQQRAAEITVEQGYQYFVIEGETETRVVNPNGSSSPPSNLYQDLIVEGDFDQNQENESSLGAYPALRIVFSIYATKAGNALDACKYTDCK